MYNEVVGYDFMVNFAELKQLIKDKSESMDFVNASKELESFVFNLNKNDLIPIITEIGVIPESIIHDSTEEKLYAKVTDIVLSKCFQELGLKSSVIKQRANCADVIAKSIHHGYSLIGDAKAFRLSRTAKNQKDFKVESMVHWRGDDNYAVLVCPYFQYPKTNSQIYGQALNGNISLFSWEYLSLLLQNNVKETKTINLSELWNISYKVSQNTNISERNNNFMNKQNDSICEFLSIKNEACLDYFSTFKQEIINRGEQEIVYWNKKIKEIEAYTKEKAVSELISSLKLNEKIIVIERYISSLRK